MSKYDDIIFYKEFKVSPSKLFRRPLIIALFIYFLAIIIFTIFISIPKNLPENIIKYMNLIHFKEINLFYFIFYLKFGLKLFIREITNFYATDIKIGENDIFIKANKRNKFIVISKDNIDYIKKIEPDIDGKKQYNCKFKVFMKDKSSHTFYIDLFSNKDKIKIENYLLNFNINKNKELLKDVNDEKYINIVKNKPSVESLVPIKSSKEDEIIKISDEKIIFLSKDIDSILFLFALTVISIPTLLLHPNLTYKIRQLMTVITVCGSFYVLLEPLKLIINMDDKTIKEKNVLGINKKNIYMPDIKKISIINDSGVKLKFVPYTGKIKTIKISKFNEKEELEILRVVSKMFNRDIIFESSDNNIIL